MSMMVTGDAVLRWFGVYDGTISLASILFCSVSGH